MSHREEEQETENINICRRNYIKWEQKSSQFEMLNIEVLNFCSNKPSRECEETEAAHTKHFVL